MEFEAAIEENVNDSHMKNTRDGRPMCDGVLGDMAVTRGAGEMERRSTACSEYLSV